MAYTRVTWVDSPSTSTPMDAALLNTMDAYIATLDAGVAWKAQANIFTAAQEIDLALSAADKTFLTLNATDGKKYALVITTGGAFQIKNVTDAVVVFECGPASGTVYASNAAGAKTIWHSANDGDGSGLDADTIGARKIRVSTTDPGLATGGAWIKDA